ncbi:helix-turn-helix domain-containing protein [Enterococcus dongliensis]|uniref:Helix-turn-helix domain-containing protein n=1 Tax=Enterococcus dongliensis TaxID=2559925 RepID=A0AAW8TIV2_9ENTE|nr:helix-turn-helix domain-containing protein [Enterococcus dongliensis]MDT2634204.1 helix-turn-helix domain-containing protein [Enterococcus dongliensis]MDT2637134.1 helix-turn-helix domain-containing protein [Enterococcus dongliensis]MDT2640003.1 helix-turn-helix domain-containing protein [Enterococcus dongliensis]MDT2671267.1 helix-turn-helix domain-containing protein [Enterococcus dongliensis]
MRRLLKNTTQRRLAIIGVLRDLIGWQNPEMIADLLDCSTKTVLSDVEAINQFWGEHVGIEYSRTNGLRLNDALHNKTRQLAWNLMNESEAFTFLERIFFQPNEDTDYWINELFISEATFYRMVKQLDKVLAEKGLILERKPFRVTAKEERWVRIFYVQLFLEKYGLNEWPFDLERGKIINFIRKASRALGIFYNDREILESSYLLAVIIVRTSQGFILSECEKLALNPTVITNVLTLRTIADQIVQDSEYHVTERWYDEVANSLFCNYFITKVDPCCQVSAKYLVNFLKEIELVYEISLPKDQRETILQKLMQIHAAYQVCPYQRSILFDSAAYFSRNAKLQYPHFTKYIHQLLLKMERESGDPWFSQFYFSVLTVLFKEWEGLARSLDIHSAKVKIFVVSDSGEGHAAMIAELIRSHFYYRVAIEVHRGSALDFSYDESFKKYDLVVANYPIKNYSYGNLKIVDDFLTESDLSSIGSFVKNVR